MRRQGRLHSTLRPSRHSSTTGASSTISPSYSSTAGSIRSTLALPELGLCASSTPVGSGQLGRPFTASKPAAPEAADSSCLALQGAGAAVAAGSVGCGRGVSGEAATAAAGPRREGQHCAPSPLSPATHRPSPQLPLCAPALVPHIPLPPEARHDSGDISTYQGHGVFAVHSKFGTFQVPKEFLNTNKKAPAAVAPKQAVRQVR